MPDETTSTPAPANVPVPQTPETPISTPPDAVIVQAPAEVPVEPVPVSEPALVEPSGQMVGNEPFTTAQPENQPAPAETPVVTTEPAPVETSTTEVTPTETTQPTQVEPVNETAPAEPTPAPQVETQASSSVSETITAQAQTLTPVTPTPVEVTASVVAPVVAPTIIQTVKNTVRELLNKAQLTIQNKKRKKIDRVMTLFAKQTKITNNEVEKLLHISDATATRYLITLEKEGKIKQNGKTGHAVSYTKI